MSIYTVEKGDTFETIARKVYGLETDARFIKTANPDALEPLTPGIVLNIPKKDFSFAIPKAGASNDVSLFVNENQLNNYQSIKIKKRIDGFSTINFFAPFDPNDKQMRKDFRPFSYSSIIVAIGDEIQFFGNVINISPSSSATNQTIGVDGYSRAALLNDCQFPASALPLEFNNQKLDEIATSLCNALALRPVFDADVGGKFERIAVKPEENAFAFLSKIAKQRNLIIRDDADGQPVFAQSIDDAVPVAILHEGDTLLTSITPKFNSQTYYSHITAISNATLADDGQQYTVKNGRLPDAFRPHTFKPNDTGKQDAQVAAAAKMGRMFANAVSYQIIIPSWRDPNGDLWAVNTIVSLLAPGAMIYNETKFLVRDVEFSREKESETATLNLVLPGSFSGKIPEVLPWD